MKTAALAYGYWGQNIGNAFFQIGGKALLRRVLGPEGVALVQDVPAHWTLHRKSQGNPTNWWNMTSRVEADFAVFQGPSLDEHSREALDDTLAQLVKRGVEPIFLSIGLMSYTPTEAELARDLIDRHGIRIVVTRDRRTFDALEGRASYSGIDSAFFLPWAVQPTPLSTAPFVALSFERIIEPAEQIRRIVSGKALRPDEPSASRVVTWANHAGRRSQAAAYAIHRIGRRQQAKCYGQLDAVRLVHRTNPAHMAKIFRDTHVVASDEPYSYIAAYGNAALTLTDRVHACVAALSFERPAMMWYATPRNALLERVGLHFPMTEPAAIPYAQLEAERSAEFEFLRDVML